MPKHLLLVFLLLEELALWGAHHYVPCLLKNEKVFVKILSITKNGFLSISTKDSIVNTVNAKDIKFLLS